MIRNQIERSLQRHRLQDDAAQDGRALRTALFLAMFGFASAAAAATVTWNRDALIPVGLQPLSETVVRLPEPISKYWPENANEVSIAEVDDRTLSIRPKVEHTEQRFFARGQSGELYVAKLSTALDHIAIIEVQALTAEKLGSLTTGTSASMAPTSLLVDLMKGEVPPGFQRAESKRELLRSETLLIEAREVWSSPAMTGIRAKLSRIGPAGSQVRIKASAIQILIPELGHMRIIGADAWTLDDATPSTQGYLVYTKH